MEDSGLTPSILAGVFAILGITIGATLQRNLERRRWLRDTRYILYSEFSELALHGAEANMKLSKAVDALPPHASLDDDRAQVLASTMQDHGKQLERLYYRIRMVGSIKMQHMADNIAGSADEVVRTYTDERLTITPENFRGHLLLYHEDVDEFIHAARSDLRSIDLIDETRNSIYWRVKRLQRRFRPRRTGHRTIN